jgi:hypothetical protein
MAKPQTIDDLAPNPRNPRRIKPKAGEGLKTSLSKFGDLSGITFNTRSGQLVCGHQRLAKLRELGGEYRDGSVWVGSREFPVRVVDWDAQTEREANVAANNEAIQGTWDDSIEEYLREIRAGMSQDEFSDLRFDELGELLHLDFAMPDPGMPDLPTDEDKNFWQLTFVLHTQQKETVMGALSKAEEMGGGTDPDNPNKNGNLLTFICANFS